MNRRRFLELSSLSLLMAGCGFEYSPYQVTPSRTALNSHNINAIAAMEGTLLYPYAIALVADTHTYYEHYGRVAAAIAQDSSCRFALHAGDMTDTGLQKEYDWNYEFGAGMGIPLVSAIGNHDALSNGLFIYTSMYGPLNFSFKAALNHYICWNSNNWEFGPYVPDWEWLEQELNSAYAQVSVSGGQIYMLQHVPHDDADRYSAEERLRYEQLMATYGVSASLSGHNHDYRHLADVNGCDYVTVGSVQKLHYLRLSVTGPNPQDFTIEKIDV